LLLGKAFHHFFHLEKQAMGGDIDDVQNGIK